MQKGQCIKCQSKNLRVVPGNQCRVHFVLGGMSAGAFIEAYVCVDCGFSEFYVEDKKDLEKIAQRYREPGK